MSLTDEQKRMRATAYGASEVATVVGKGFGRKIDLYESKVNPRFDDVENLDEMLAAELGTLEEEPVAQVYARRTGTFLHPVRTLRHPTKPLAVATPDRARFQTEDAWSRAWERAKQKAVENSVAMLDGDDLEEADRLVEVKTHAARFRSDYGREGSGSVPAQEAIQTTWQMGVTGLGHADIPVLFRGDWGVKLEVFTVAYNEELFDWLYESVERFHVDHVLKMVPPPPDGSEAYDDALGRVHSVVRKAHLNATPVDEDMMLRWAKFDAVERRAKEYKARTAQALMERIGDSAGLLSADLGKLSWIAVREGSTVSWKKAAEDALALCGMCLNAFDTIKASGEQLTDENRAKLVERLKAIVPDATKQKAGFRYLRMFPKGEADLELKRLNVALDALENGE